MEPHPPEHLCAHCRLQRCGRLMVLIALLSVALTIDRSGALFATVWHRAVFYQLAFLCIGAGNYCIGRDHTRSAGVYHQARMTSMLLTLVTTVAMARLSWDLIRMLVVWNGVGVTLAMVSLWVFYILQIMLAFTATFTCSALLSDG